MALFFADLVREASWGTGDGDLPLGGALPGHRSFADAVPPGARFHYAICGVTHPGEWETGEGEIGEGGALARTPIASIRLASELPAAERPRFEYLSTESASFAQYANARANRHDTFFIKPAGGVDICNAPVPVRRVAAAK